MVKIRKRHIVKRNISEQHLTAKIQMALIAMMVSVFVTGCALKPGCELGPSGIPAGGSGQGSENTSGSGQGSESTTGEVYVAGSKSAAGAGLEEAEMIKRTFDAAKEFNENSNIDVALLADIETGEFVPVDAGSEGTGSEGTGSEGASSEGTSSGDESSKGSGSKKPAQASADIAPEATFDGKASAYGFTYPKGNKRTCWTQIDIEDDSCDIFGIRVGDDISKINPIMEEYKYDYVQDEQQDYSWRNSDHNIEYRKYDLHITYYLKGDEITYMHVSVYQESEIDEDVVY